MSNSFSGPEPGWRGDCIHPNEKGARFYASEVARAAQRLDLKPVVPNGILVFARQPWTDTGIDVSIGSTVNISASGKLYIAGSDPGKTPNGDFGCVQDSSAVAPGQTCNSLVGRIGGGNPFQVGTSAEITAQSSGRLYLGVNDRYGFFGDNRGYWSATVSVSPGSPPCTPKSGPGPGAVDDCVSTHANTGISIYPLANDLQGDQVAIYAWNYGSHGSVSGVYGSGHDSYLTYRPNSGFVGVDRFRFYISDWNELLLGEWYYYRQK